MELVVAWIRRQSKETRRVFFVLSLFVSCGNSTVFCGGHEMTAGGHLACCLQK